MRMNKVLLTITALLCTSVLFAQNYSGIVLEKDGKTPIVGVSVCLVTSNGMLTAWGYTDNEGVYSVSLPKDKTAEKIYYSLLGYKKISIPLSDFPSDGKVILESEDFHLEEVKVTAQRIIEKQDTLVYSVAGFSQPQDRSIADVIAKMPGMEVKENGQISFNGKNINKFYIEGMDLMSDRYALASNNISKQRIKSVEVLQNHQPVELLRGKSFSEQAAINLVLEDDSKMNLVGTADLGLGANKDDLLYNNRLMAMLFGRKHQNLSIYKNDNTGYDLFNEINPITLSELTKENLMESGLVSSITANSPGIDRSRYMFNQSHLVATNHLAQLAEKTTLRTQISYFNDISKQSNVIETEYLFPDASDKMLYESNLWKEKRNRLDANLNFELNRPNLYVKNELKGTFDWVSTNSQTTLNDRQQNLHSSPNRQFISDVLDIKLPISNDRYISIVSTNNYNYQPQDLSLYSGETQRVDYSSFYSNTTASFRHRLWRMYANHQIGFQGMFQSFSSTVGDVTSISKQRYERYMPYVGTGLQLDNQTIHMDADIKMNLYNWQLEGTDTNRKKTKLSPDARFYFKYSVSATSDLSLNYRYSELLQDLRQVYDGNLFTSYRTIVNNSHTPEADGTHSLTLRYQYSQPIKGIFFTLSALGSTTHRHSAYITTLQPESEILVRTKKDADYNSEMYLINGRFSKSFGWWKSLLAVSGSYMKSYDAQYNGDELQDYNMDNYSAGISFSARPLSWLSFELESQWQQTRMKSELTDSRINQLKHNANLTFPITRSFQFGINNTIYQSLETKENSWFTDFMASYTYKRMEFQLNVNNILGKSTYEREFISSIERNYYRYTLRPREVLAKVSFTF